MKSMTHSFAALAAHLAGWSAAFGGLMESPASLPAPMATTLAPVIRHRARRGIKRTRSKNPPHHLKSAKAHKRRLRAKRRREAA